MRKSRFSKEQMAASPLEAASTSVAGAAKENEVSDQAIHASHKHFSEPAPVDFKRLRTREAENACLRRLQAERSHSLQHPHGLLRAPMDGDGFGLCGADLGALCSICRA